MKRFFSIAFMISISINLICQVQWTKYANNPIIVTEEALEWEGDYITPGTVIYIDGVYHMWYCGGDSGDTRRIGHASSADGISWTRDPNNPVLDIGEEGAWDENTLYDCSVVLVDDVYHMWYSGHTGTIANKNYRIGHATSVDGVSWIKDDTNNPVLDMGTEGEWDADWIIISCVVYVDEVFHMYYKAWNDGSGALQTGHATSMNGVSWEKDPQNPVLVPKGSDLDWPETAALAVVHDGSKYHMWYSSKGHWLWNFGHASSIDGSTWIKSQGYNPVLIGSDGSWDKKFIDRCAVLDSAGSSFKMWYSGGVEDGKTSIGYAESSPFVAIPDTAFLAALIEEGVDTNEDGKISYAEVEGVIELDVRGEEDNPGVISDLTGVETFINLVELNCSHNQLTSLDVSSITALNSLDCSSNQISSLDVSNNWSLLDLSCSDNQLTSLDVSNNTSIISLDCSYNKLTSLDVSNNVDLKYFCCSGNKLTSLNISNNIALGTGGMLVAVLDLSDMPTLQQVCVWELPFPPEERPFFGYTIDGSPNINYNMDCIVGIEEKYFPEIISYPNPTNNHLTIETDIPDCYYLEIHSLNGQLICKEEMEGYSHQIDMTPFSKGVYFVTVRSDAWVRTEKVVRY